MLNRRANRVVGAASADGNPRRTSRTAARAVHSPYNRCDDPPTPCAIRRFSEICPTSKYCVRCWPTRAAEAGHGSTARSASVCAARFNCGIATTLSASPPSRDSRSPPCPPPVPRTPRPRYSRLRRRTWASSRSCQPSTIDCRQRDRVRPRSFCADRRQAIDQTVTYGRCWTITNHPVSACSGGRPVTRTGANAASQRLDESFASGSR